MIGLGFVTDLLNKGKSLDSLDLSGSGTGWSLIEIIDKLMTPRRKIGSGRSL